MENDSKCIKITKNDCMEATIIFTYEDNSTKTVAFVNKTHRNRMYNILISLQGQSPKIV